MGVARTGETRETPPHRISAAPNIGADTANSPSSIGFQMSKTSVEYRDRQSARVCAAVGVVFALIGVSSCSTNSPADSSSSVASSTAASAPKGLGFGSYDDIVLGMSMTEVSQRGYQLTAPSQGDGCRSYTATTPSGRTVKVGFTAASGRLSTIAASSGGGTALVPHDPATEAQLRAAYPGATISRLTTNGMMQKTFTVVSQPSTPGQLYFTVDSSGQLTAPMTAPRVPIGCPEPTS